MTFIAEQWYHVQMIWKERFSVEDVEACAHEVAGLQHIDERLLLDDRTAGDLTKTARAFILARSPARRVSRERSENTRDPVALGDGPGQVLLGVAVGPGRSVLRSPR
jgi:hypothetical protein